MKSLTVLVSGLALLVGCASQGAPRVHGDASINADNPSRSPAHCMVKWDDDYGGYVCANGNCPSFSCNPHRLGDGTVVNVVKCL